MGHGAPRTLSGKTELIPINEELSAKLSAALKTFDSIDEDFKTSREDELRQQVSKAWTAQAEGIVNDLRQISLSIVESHQILCDMGQEGAGAGIRPWIEESGFRLPKMEIVLNGQQVSAKVGDHTLRSTHMNSVDYQWLEEAVVEWMIYSVEQKAKSA